MQLFFVYDVHYLFFLLLSILSISQTPRTIDAGRGDVATALNHALGRGNDPSEYTPGKPRVLRVVPALDALDGSALTAAAAPLHDFCDTNDLAHAQSVLLVACNLPSDVGTSTDADAVKQAVARHLQQVVSFPIFWIFC